MKPKVNHLVPYVSPVPKDGGLPSSSWWLDLPRQTFQQAADRELTRMLTSKFGRMTGNVSESPQ